MDRPENPSVPEVRVQKKAISPAKLWIAWFAFLLVLALLAFGVNGLFGRIAVESYTSDELYSKLTDGRREVRRMAAAEWSRMLLDEVNKSGAKSPRLEQIAPTAEQVTRLGRELSQSLEDPDAPDATFLSGVATVLGFARDSVPAKKALTDYLVKTREKNVQQDAQIYALVALGRLGDLNQDEVALVVSYGHNASPDLRKTAAYALGASHNATGEGLDTLKALLTDTVEDVRWNSALALARLHLSDGVPVLKTVLEEAKSAKVEEITPEKFTLYIQVLKAAGEIGSPELKVLVSEIADSHPNLKLRQAAKDVRY